MQEFSTYIDFCAQQFNSMGKCQNCPYGQCIHVAQDVQGVDCYSCLYQIHRYVNQKWKYQCCKIIYNYVLKFGHRYASEIDKILSFLVHNVTLPQELNVMSVGSGPCTELFGVMNQFSGHTVHFKGFDLNEIWEPMTLFEKTLFPNKDIQFHYEDFFEYINKTDEVVDVLILNYMLSDMARYEGASVCSAFIDKIVKLCEEQRIKLILVNDVYLTYASRTGYALMEELARKIQFNRKINSRSGRWRFTEPKSGQVVYGTRYNDNGLSFPIVENSVAGFNSFSPCNSIFLFIAILLNNEDV